MSSSFRLTDPSFPLVVSGPSGVGKTVLCRALLNAVPGALLSVSATTRPPRTGERDGESYHFWTDERFEHEVEGGGMAEWARVHGHSYGTPRRRLDERLRDGRTVVLNIDVQGGMLMRAAYPTSVLVFVLPPSLEVLDSRLRRRATDSDEEITRRLRTAEEEIGRLPEYDYVVVNDRLEVAVGELALIVRAERARISRRLPPDWEPPALTRSQEGSV